MVNHTTRTWLPSKIRTRETVKTNLHLQEKVLLIHRKKVPPQWTQARLLPSSAVTPMALLLSYKSHLLYASKQSVQASLLTGKMSGRRLRRKRVDLLHLPVSLCRTASSSRMPMSRSMLITRSWRRERWVARLVSAWWTVLWQLELNLQLLLAALQLVKSLTSVSFAVFSLLLETVTLLKLAPMVWCLSLVVTDIWCLSTIFSWWNVNDE